MYEYLKDLLEMAAGIGEPLNVNCYTDHEYYGNKVEVEGRTPEGLEFTIKLVIKGASNDA